MAAISFAKDIKQMFRAVDVAHMKRFGVLLDDYAQVQTALSAQNGNSPSMPPGGPYWNADQVALFLQWRNDGYQP